MHKLVNKPLVSVIVPTYNSEKTLEQCLNSIKNQTYASVETIVVDNFSVDGTQRIVEQSGATRFFILKVERSGARNFGAKHAKGEFLLFVDSDMILNSKVIEESVDKCKREHMDAVAIPEESVGQGKISCLRKSEKSSLSESSAFEIPRFFRKTVFMEAGGYDEQLVCGEDYELFQRLKSNVLRFGKIDSAIVHVEGKQSLHDVLLKTYYYGRTFPALLKKNPSAAVERYANLRLTSVKNAGHSFRTMGMLMGFALLKLLEYIAYSFGIATKLAESIFEKDLMIKVRKWAGCNKVLIVNSAIIVFVGIAIFRNLLFTQEWPGGGDVLGFVSRAYLYGKDFRWLQMWRPYSFGFVEGINFMDFFLMVGYLVFRDPSWTVKAFMFLSYLVGGFAVYLFCFTHVRSHAGSLAASLVYMLNQWLFSQLTEAHVDILFSYAVAPLIFLLLDRALRSGRLKDILLFGLGTSLFVTSFHPECIVIYGVFLLIFALTFVLFPTRNETVTQHLRRFAKVVLPSSVIVFLLSAFFLIPFIIDIRSPYVHPSYEYPLDDAYMCSYRNLTDAFTLRAVERWGYSNVVDVYSELGLPDFPVYTFLLVIFTLAYLTLLVRRNRYTVFFTLAMLISVFIAKGPNPPFGDVFIWAWFNVPHFAIFRAANRWIMMTVFSTAFMISVLVSLTAKYVRSRTSSEENRNYFKVEVKNGRKKTKFAISIEFFDRLLPAIRKALKTSAIVLLLFMFLSGFISCSFFFQHGLQIYTVPSQCRSAFQWLALQQDDCKVVTVGRSSYEWLISPDQCSDFASSAMQTTLGWGHDIGFDSSFIHDKPVLQDGGWDFKTRRFVDYLRFRLAREHLTDNLLEILGTFAYKYVVIPPYVTDKTREFFLNQEGGEIVYNTTSSLILENEYAMPRIFAANQSTLVVGGLESVDALAKVENFRLNETVLYFSSGGNNFASLLDKTQMVSFANSNLLDLAMTSLVEGRNIIYTGKYGLPSLDTAAYWVKMSSWRNIGAMVLSGETMTTSGKNKADFTLDLDSEGEHEVWLRIGFAPSRGKLSVIVDGQLVQEIRTESALWSKLAWLNVTRLNLTKGKHAVNLINDGTGYNDVDALAIVSPSELEFKVGEIVNALNNYSGRIICLLEAESAFLDDPNSGWQWTVSPYNGYVVRSESMGTNVASQASASASSLDGSFEARNAIDGNMQTRWTSEKYVLPQWLEVSWNEPQELSGVGIRFENATAADYAVQTWDGTSWVDQAIVTGNTAFERTHRFTQLVKTVRLRVFVTAFHACDRVSIWELEAYSIKATASAKIMIPKKGNYVIAARVSTGPNCGALRLEIDNTAYQMSCEDPTCGFQWRQMEACNLDSGEHLLSVGGSGTVELDEILMYSLRDAESFLSFEELFGQSSPKVSLSHEKVDEHTFQVQVDASEPFNMIFSETYHPLWKATISGEEIESDIAYSIVNSFAINRTGKYTIIIEFIGQRYADWGIAVSTSSFAAICISIALISTPFRKKFLKTKIKEN